METPYNKIDHTHCFNQENPPCGIKGKHRCCLCEEPVPSKSTHNTREGIEEQYKCKSYYDDNRMLRDCTCGKCIVDDFVENVWVGESDELISLAFIKQWLTTTFQSVQQTHHQELQKAQAEVKYEVIKLLAGNTPIYEKRKASAYNEGVTSGWYAAREFIRLELNAQQIQSELDQPTESKKICCRWCCSEKHEHIQCTDSSRCHCPCHDQPTNITSE